MSKKKPIAVQRIKIQANQGAVHDDGVSYCECGTCREAVLVADEILRTNPNMKCAVFTMQLAAVLFARGADQVTMEGMSAQAIQAVFNGSIYYAHNHGMKARHVRAHFENTKIPEPKKGKIV